MNIAEHCDKINENPIDYLRILAKSPNFILELQEILVAGSNFLFDVKGEAH